MSEPHVLLLRGVNVGGRHRLPMKELVGIVEAAGGRDVRTYIQSGNVVCTTADGAALGGAVAAGIQARFGFAAPVVVRSRSEWQKLMCDNPFRVPGVDEAHLHVALLADTPAPERAARLDPDRSPGDRFALVGRDLYLHLPNGVADSRLTNAWMDSTLATVSTARNWRTITTLGEMVGSG